MAPAWSTIVGGSCQFCNAASTATAGSSVFAVGTPGGVMTSLAATGGAAGWRSPVLDGVHYEGVSTADGVVYTLDGDGFLDGFDAVTGLPVLRRAVAQDIGTNAVSFTSAGVAVAEHTVLVAASGGAGAVTDGFESSGVPDVPSSGYLVAYRAQ
jgi:outer membrane protein assembly factor BamB